MKDGPNLTVRGLLLLGGLGAILAVVSVVFWLPLLRPGPSGAAPKTADQQSSPGWEIRYNATATLARRGSPKLPLNILREMLDEPQQMRNFFPKDAEATDEAAARRTVIHGLKVFAEWHAHPSEPAKTVGADNEQLKKVYEAVDRLAESSNPVVKKEAETTRAVYRKS